MVETTVVVEKGKGGDGGDGGGGGGGEGGGGVDNEGNKVVVVAEIPIPPVAEVPTWRVDYLPTFRESPEYIRSRGGECFCRCFSFFFCSLCGERCENDDALSLTHTHALLSSFLVLPRTFPFFLLQVPAGATSTPERAAERAWEAA